MANRNHRVPGTPGQPPGLESAIDLSQTRGPLPTVTMTTRVVMNVPSIDFFSDANEIVPYLGVRNQQTDEPMAVIGFRPVPHEPESVFTYYVLGDVPIEWLYNRLAEHIQSRHGKAAPTLEWASEAILAIQHAVDVLNEAASLTVDTLSDDDLAVVRDRLARLVSDEDKTADALGSE